MNTDKQQVIKRLQESCLDEHTKISPYKKHQVRIYIYIHKAAIRDSVYVSGI